MIHVHEGSRALSQIAQLVVPGEQHHVRLINHQADPGPGGHVVNRQPTQVADAHNIILEFASCK